MSREDQFYAEDLAYIHHVGYSGFANSAAPALLSALQTAGLKDGLVVDLGCGGGYWLSVLDGAGYETMGVDISPAFIALAAKTAPNAKLVTSSVYDVELPNCHAVTAIGEVLCYVYPNETEAPPLENVGEMIFDSLTPGGLFMFDLVVADGSEPLSGQHASSGADWALIADKNEDKAGSCLTRHITLFREVDGHYRRSEETHCQHLFEANEVEQILRRIGFSVKMSKTYDAFLLPPRRVAFTATKP